MGSSLSGEESQRLARTNPDHRKQLHRSFAHGKGTKRRADEEATVAALCRYASNFFSFPTAKFARYVEE